MRPLKATSRLEALTQVVHAASVDDVENSSYDDAWDEARVAATIERATSVVTPSRWTEMRLSDKQRAYYNCMSRFVMVPAGRRTGKSEIAKRRGVARATGMQRFDDARYVFAAPTYRQAKRIFWHDLKRLVPPEMVIDIREGELVIRLYNGAEIAVLGLDAPERIEGSPLDGIVMDEFGNIKPDAWSQNVRPALADRQGWADIIGVPEGRNHYWDMWSDALVDDTGNWSTFHWTSEEVLPLYLGEELAANEIAQAKHDLDPWTYEQEYLASFKTFSGRAYYGFTDENKLDASGFYKPEEPLCICLDFNVEPGIAAIVQEYPIGAVVIDEVYIPKDSNTEKVTKVIAERWAEHKGDVLLYGDPAGGHRHTSQMYGSDWNIVKSILHPVFGDRLMMRVSRSDPGMRMRINAMNMRCCSTDGTRRLFVDKKCKYTIRDFEGVTLSGSGLLELDKSVKTLTHITDAIAYYVCRRFGMPSVTPNTSSREV